MVRVRSINMYMSTEKEAAGATVILNTPGTPVSGRVVELVKVGGSEIRRYVGSEGRNGWGGGEKESRES